MKARLALSVFIVGVVLLVAAYAWPRLVGGRRVWTEKDAQQHTRAMIRAHQLAHQHADEHDQGDAQGDTVAGGHTPNEAVEAFRRGQAALDAARSRGQASAAVLRWLGLLAAVGGGMMYLASQGQT